MSATDAWAAPTTESTASPDPVDFTIAYSGEKMWALGPGRNYVRTLAIYSTFSVLGVVGMVWAERVTALGFVWILLLIGHVSSKSSMKNRWDNRTLRFRFDDNGIHVGQGDAASTTPWAGFRWFSRKHGIVRIVGGFRRPTYQLPVDDLERQGHYGPVLSWLQLRTPEGLRPSRPFLVFMAIAAVIFALFGMLIFVALRSR